MASSLAARPRPKRPSCCGCWPTRRCEGGSPQRVFEALVGLVDPHRPLHGHALRGRALGREAVRVHTGLELATAGVEFIAVEAVPLRQAKEREVVVGDVHKAFS